MGENVTSMRHDLVGARESPGVQVVVLAMEKSPLLVNLARMSGEVPLLLSVTLLMALMLPTFCVPKLSDAGLSNGWGLITVPFSATVCGLPTALSVMISEAFITPS